MGGGADRGRGRARAALGSTERVESRSPSLLAARNNALGVAACRALAPSPHLCHRRSLSRLLRS
eukprot:9276861-Alexandrium_andersonii.AAC.1